MKVCTKCGQTKPTDKFPKCKSSSGKEYYRNECTSCHKEAESKRRYSRSERGKEQNRMWREQNPEKLRLIRQKASRKQNWKLSGINITEEEYNQIRENQKYKCAICGISEEELGKQLVVDHCHKSNKIRGCLCSRCNLGIGNLQDSILLLYKSINYLNIFDGKDEDDRYGG